MRVFVISWVGQHERAAAIAQALQGRNHEVAIVYSDPDPRVEPQADCRHIRRPNELFWSDKFKACMESAGSDMFMVLHADCLCDDWPGLIDRCLDAFGRIPQLGVWSPLTRGCHFEVEATRTSLLPGTSISLVANTDALCFAISASIAARMKRADYSKDIYGWGISWMMTATAHCHNMLVAVDEAVEVRHLPGRGYPVEDAIAQFVQFTDQFSPQERIQFTILNRFVTTQKRRLARGGQGSETGQAVMMRRAAPGPGTGSMP